MAGITHGRALAAGLGLALLAGGAAAADEPGGSLYEKRLGVMKGTAPGVLVIGARKPAAAASGAAAGAPPGAAAPAAAAAKPLVERLGDAVKWGESPTGQPLSAARRGEPADGGIVLPTAAPTPSAGGRPRTPD